jgi:ABC-type transport system involved in multi-copper enzyme maturation permease subunit
MPLRSELAIAEVVFRRVGTRWFAGLCAAACVVLYMVVADTGPDPALQIIRNRERAVALIGFVSAVLAVIIAATEIPRDVSSRVLLIVLSNPVKRYEFVIGKFLGLVGLSLLFAAVCAVFTAGGLWAYGLPPDAVLARAVGMVAIRTVLVGAVALLFSTALGEMPCISFTFIYIGAAFAVGLIAPLVTRLPLPAPARAAISLLLYLTPDLKSLCAPETAFSRWIAGDAAAGGAREASVSLDALLMGVTPQWDQLGAAMLYALVYVSVLLALAVLAFRRRSVA